MLEDAEGFLRTWFFGVLGVEGVLDRLWGRDFGDPRRRFIPGIVYERFLGEVKRCSGRGRPCFLSVNYYSGVAGKPGSPIALEKVFIDIDYPGNIDKAMRTASRIVGVLESYCRPLVVFSGGKGYHVYCFFNPVIEGDKEFLKLVLEHTVLLLKIPLDPGVDDRVVFDVSRLSRIPYTVHEKTGKLTVVVDERDFKPVEAGSIRLEWYWSKPIPRSIVGEAVSLAREFKGMGRRSRSHRRIRLEDATWMKFLEKPELLRMALAGVSGDLRLRIARELALYYRNVELMGYEECLAKLLEWDERNNPPLGRRVIEELVKNVYGLNEYAGKNI